MSASMHASVDSGVVLAVEERGRKLQNVESVVKMFQIDDHIGAVGAGYIPDARIQVDNARVIAQSNRLVYDEPVVIQCYTAAALIEQQAAPLRAFLVRMGTEAQQGAVGLVIDRDYLEIGFPLAGEAR